LTHEQLAVVCAAADLEPRSEFKFLVLMV